MKRNSILFALSLLLCVGCGDKVSLKGKVVFSDDGSLLTTGVVLLETDTYLARGMIKPDGTFVASSTSTNDGLPPGIYRVSIRGAQKLIGHSKIGEDVFESLIDPKFADGTTSGITIEVKSPMKPVEIKDRYKEK